MLQILLHAIRERPLDRKEEPFNSCRRSDGKDQQMHVLWHIDKGNQPKSLLDQNTVDALREQGTYRRVSQEWKSMKTREGQFMTMTKFVEMPHSFSVRNRKEHDCNRKTIITKVPVAPGALPSMVVVKRWLVL